MISPFAGHTKKGAFKIFSFLDQLENDYLDCSTDVIPNYINKINTFKNENYHLDIGTFENLEKAKLDFKNFQKF